MRIIFVRHGETAHNNAIVITSGSPGRPARRARVVAAILARMRLSKVVLNGPYDVVLVDEVGAATVPEVLLALSRAGTR